MVSENKFQKRYWYKSYEGYEVRCQRRIQEDLGFDESVAETILNLRNQVIELQSQIRQLETELNAQFASQNIRLAAYREVYNDAIWIEIELQE